MFTGVLMTSEIRHLVQMIDVRGLEITCPNDKCGMRLVLSFISAESMPGVCPLCGKPVFDPTTNDWRSAKELRNSIAQLTDHKVSNVRFEIIGIGK
jgi:hypothetical protein